MRLASLSAVLLVAACGGGSPATPDGPGPAAAVRVTVTQAGQPVGALTVYFLEADGTLVSTAITDAAGRASAELHAGGSVTVVHASLPPTADAYQLDSWVAVQPGDALALDLPVAAPGVNLQVSAPVASLAGVMSYRVVSPCGASAFFLAGQRPELSLAPNCLGDARTTDFTVFAQGTDEQDIAALVAPMIGVPPDTQDLALAGDYQPLVDVPIAYAHTGSEQDLTVEVHAVGGGGQTPVANASFHGTSGSLGGTFHWPSQLTTGTRVIESYPGPDTEKEILSWAPVTSSVALDLTDQLGQDMTSQATIDAAHQQITWTIADDGVPAQIAIASMEVMEDAGTYVAWTIVAPGATPQIALPQLPRSVISIANPAQVGVGMVLLRVPGGTVSWTQVLGAGGYRAGFSGLISASPSGAISEVFSPAIPL